MRHLTNNWKKYLFTGIVLIIFTVAVHISTGSVRDELLKYVEMEQNFSIAEEINEDTVIDLEYGDEILLYHDEVEFRLQIVQVTYILSAVLIVVGGAGLALELKSE